LNKVSNPKAYLWKVLGLASFERMFKNDKVHTNEESFDSPHWSDNTLMTIEGMLDMKKWTIKRIVHCLM